MNTSELKLLAARKKLSDRLSWICKHRPRYKNNDADYFESYRLMRLIPSLMTLAGRQPKSLCNPSMTSKIKKVINQKFDYRYWGPGSLYRGSLGLRPCGLYPNRLPVLLVSIMLFWLSSTNEFMLLGLRPLGAARVSFSEAAMAATWYWLLERRISPESFSWLPPRSRLTPRLRL